MYLPICLWLFSLFVDGSDFWHVFDVFYSSAGPSIASGLDSRKSSLMQSYDTQYCPVTQ